MHASGRPQEGAQSSASSFTRVAVDFPHTVTIVIARPLVLAMIDRGVRHIQSVVTAVLIRIDHSGVLWDGFGQNAMTGRLVTVPDHPAAFLARLAADDMNDWWSVVVIGAMPGLLIRAAAGWIVGVFA
jgi:hypothetical protein